MATGDVQTMTEVSRVSSSTNCSLPSSLLSGPSSTPTLAKDEPTSFHASTAPAPTPISGRLPTPPSTPSTPIPISALTASGSGVSLLHANFTSPSIAPTPGSGYTSAHFARPTPVSSPLGTSPVVPALVPQVPSGRYKRFHEVQADYKPGGYARVKPGMTLNNDREKQYVAVKIVRSSTRYTRAAMAEDKLLTVIQGPRDDRREFLVQFIESFEYRADGSDLHHVCLVFEVLGMSLAELLRKNSFVGLPIGIVKKVVRQILFSLSYLHSLNVVHTDLKPDNILLHHEDIGEIVSAQLKADRQHVQRQMTPSQVEQHGSGAAPQNSNPQHEVHHHAKNPLGNDARDVIRTNATIIPGVHRSINLIPLNPPSSDPEQPPYTIEDAYPKHPTRGKVVASLPGISDESRMAIAKARYLYNLSKFEITEPQPIDFTHSPRESSGSGSGESSELGSRMDWVKGRMVDEHGNIVGRSVVRTSAGPAKRSNSPPLDAMRESTRHPGLMHTSLSLPTVPTLRDIQPDPLETLATPTSATSPLQKSERSLPATDSGVGFVDPLSATEPVPGCDSTSVSRSRSNTLTGTSTLPSNSLSPTVNLSSSSDHDATHSDSQPPMSPAMSKTQDLESSVLDGSHIRQDFDGTDHSDPDSGELMNTRSSSKSSFFASEAVTRSHSASSSLTSDSYGTDDGTKVQNTITSPGSTRGNNGSILSFNTISSEECFRPDFTNFGIGFNSAAVVAPGSESGHTADFTVSSTPSSPSIPDPSFKYSQSLRALPHYRSCDSDEEDDFNPYTDPNNRLYSSEGTEVRFKLADMGNAIFFSESKSKGALPEYICTRQYRPPENIIGADWGSSADIWALGCVIFELITGDLLFNPTFKKGKWSKEDDLLGQQIELLGPFPPDFALSGRKSSLYFNKQGKLSRLRLRPWLLYEVMVEKYKMPVHKAKPFCEFMLRMLQCEPWERATADELLQDPWLTEEVDDDIVLYRKDTGNPSSS